MNTTNDEPTMQELAARLAELEQVNVRLRQELAALQAGQPMARTQKMTLPQEDQARRQRSISKRKSRRGMLTKGLGVALATVGAGTLFEMSAGTAYAKSNGVFISNIAGTPAVSATGTNGADGVDASSDSGIGVSATSSSGPAVFAQSSSGIGVHAVGGGASPTSGPGAAAVFAEGGPHFGVFATGTSNVITGISSGGIGVNGISTSGMGVTGSSQSGDGVNGVSQSSNGVFAGSNSGNAVFAQSSSGTGVFAQSTSGSGIIGESQSAIGVEGVSQDGPGVQGLSNGVGAGVFGQNNGTGAGVFGKSTGSGAGVFGTNTGSGLAGQFVGDVTVTGTLSKGGGSFRIDHPLDPAHKYLYHSFVESPDMKNIYDGVVILDSDGEAEITLPSWFDALNIEFRYQLTAIGASGPNLYIAEEITTNRFKIAGGTAGMKVSWQVTGIRQDPWANAYRIPVELDKLVEEQGYYLHPELYGESDQRSIVYLGRSQLGSLILPQG